MRPHLSWGLIPLLVLAVFGILHTKWLHEIIDDIDDFVDDFDLDEEIDITWGAGLDSRASSGHSLHQASRVPPNTMGTSSSSHADRQDHHAGRQDHHAGSTEPHARTQHQRVAEAAPEKMGAGMLICCQGEVLLLLRNSKHNDETWGLPGGNMDTEDQGDLMACAAREATEELGNLPAAYTVKGSVLTKRGKRNQKHYTVFIVEISPEVRQQWRPVLRTKEHREARWFPLGQLGQLTGMELHPVVHRLATSFKPQVMALAAAPGR